MHTQKKDRKQQELFKDGGDTRRNRKEVQAYVPRDRGDARRSSTKKTKLEMSKTKEEVIPDVVARSTNTHNDSSPLKLQNRTNLDISPDSLDFRKRIKDKYTFKQCKKLKEDVVSQFNNALPHDDKNEEPNLWYTENQKSKDFRDTKKSEKTSVHRAVSALKLKRTSKSDEAARKLSVETEKNTNRKEKRPVIKTIRSKMDSRVYKAVTFVEQPARKPLHINIPSKDMKTKTQSNIPVCRRNDVIRNVSGTTQSTIRSAKRVPRKRPRLAPTQKTAEFQPTEIAKWAPESIDQHTQPYYEAWVSKTATASTKLVKEASIEKSKVLRSLQLDARPELLARYAAEEYAGRIRVRRRGDK